MTRLTLSLAALALITTAAVAQDDRTKATNRTGMPTVTEPAAPRTDAGIDRRDKVGTDQTVNTGRTGAAVGRDTPDTYKAGSDQAAAARREAAARGDLSRRGARGTGVATGFVAAGIGLALLGLFVRRRNRPDRYDDINRPGV